ncbi:high mobility group protein B3a [Rhinichthys klamathensis goyatoka]|uniref:high mobility group protein B3a n=1 Tax=Rhinichthys klamathensis goyatoka TaxID=3034132 RepID=UPI0024B62680|nr:high mobility group protein B3a [Rhinichthys klamathensis goyatoka]XP_056124639.1 high mobility group protein B3a [Rhinichthys klamathensis goyatoka]
MAKGDPRKPKGKMSSYAYFVQTCREEHKKKSPEIPVSFSEFSKRCSGRWKAMSDKEKSRFDDMAKQDKVRYDQEMMHYMPGGKRGKKKDPNAPKRPPSGFFLFCSDHRPQIKAQYPSLGIGDVAKKLGEQWNSLTDSNKQPYLIKANKLKDKYQKDVADYKTKGKVGGVSMPMPMAMGMMANCMAPKPMAKSNMDDEDDDEEEDEEEDDDEYDDDE